MTTCQLNGNDALRATVVLPRWGIWTADVEVGNAFVTSGPAKLQIEDLTLTGTILHGGVYATRGWYRIVGGKGGWAKPLSPKAYRSAAGVKLSTVVQDAAREVSETIGPIVDQRIGPAFMRAPKAEAARVLDALLPEAWYVDEAGVTQLSVRSPAKYTGPYRLLDSNPAQNRIMISADTITGLTPGAQLEGLEAATVRHELTDEGLRTHIYGTQGATVSDRAFQAVARFVRMIMRPHVFFAVYEYKVISSSAGYCDLQPAQRSLGLPVLGNVPMRTGLMGGRGIPATNSVVLVGFINGDPTRPYIASFDAEAAGNASSTATEADIFAASVKLGDSSAASLGDGTALQTVINAIVASSPTGTEGGYASLKSALTGAGYSSTPGTGTKIVTTKAAGT